MKFDIVKEYFEKQEQKYSDKFNEGYPHDILIDCSELMNIDDADTVFVFAKDYPSTGMIHIPRNVYKADIKEIIGSIGLFQHYMREIESYETVYIFYHGVMSERGIKTGWCREYILDLLVFWFEVFYGEIKHRLIESDMVNMKDVYDSTYRTYNIRKKECKDE